MARGMSNEEFGSKTRNQILASIVRLEGASRGWHTSAEITAHLAAEGTPYVRDWVNTNLKTLADRGDLNRVRGTHGYRYKVAG